MYAELRKLRMKVMDMFQNYKICQTERVPIIKNWLNRKSLQLFETLTQGEQQACNEEEHLFETLNNKFKLQYNETIKSL